MEVSGQSPRKTVIWGAEPQKLIITNVTSLQFCAYFLNFMHFARVAAPESAGHSIFLCPV